MNHSINYYTLHSNCFSRADTDLVIDLYFNKNKFNLIKETPSRKISSCIINLKGQEYNLLIKEYNYKIIRRLKKPLLPHRARQAYYGTRQLTKLNLSTPKNYALIEYSKHGLVTKALLITEFVKEALPLNQFINEKLYGYRLNEKKKKLKEELLGKLLLELKKQHDNHIYNRDMKSENILITCSNNILKLHYIDLEGVSYQPILFNRIRIRNLIQLNASIGREITLKDRKWFLENYYSNKSKHFIEKTYKQILKLSRIWIRRAKYR